MEQLTREEIAFVIETSTNLQQELNDIKERHSQLSDIFSELINLLPTAIWLLNDDKSVRLQNSKSTQIPLDLNMLDLEKAHDTQLEIEQKTYILQVQKVKDKTIVAATDNTKVKRDERLLVMGKMAAHLAHEIRNPLGSVSILSSMLFDEVELKNKSLVLEMKKSIFRIERIVNATLLFSKGFTINPRSFEANALQSDIQETISSYSYSKDIEFLCAFLPQKIYADFDLLCIVLQNMLINAIDAIEEVDDESGMIEFTHYRDDGFDNLVITDTGKDFQNKDTIFEAFNSTKTKGHGLGLALSKQIIQAHGGEITLCQEKKGFKIKIPQG